MKQLLLCIAALTCIAASAQDIPQFQSQFPLKWKAKIGGTTFKTNFLLHDGLLIVGSNGNHYRDWRLDGDNGVYILHPSTGKIVQHFAGEGLGDMDVNGVVAINGKVFFGNDNDEFLCYNTSGELLWRVPVSGDVESEPVLLDVNCDGSKEVVFATESGEVAALDSRNGDAIWSFKIKDFSGWNKTDNRLLFKVGAYFANGSGFVAKPAVTELSGDNVPDLIYTCRDNYTYAINGENGTLLWKFNHGEVYYAANSPLVIEEGKRKTIYLLQNRTGENNREQMHIVSLNSKGVLQKSFPSTWHYSINYAPVEHNGNLISVNRDSLAVVNLKTGSLRKINLFFEIRDSEGNYDYYNYYRFITARPQFFDLLKTGSEQLILMDEYGFVQVLDGSNYNQLRRFKLPSGTETTPLIADIDNDGTVEMLVGCRDGYVYCFDMKTSAAKGFIAGLK